MRKNKLLLLGSSLGVLVLFATAAVQEHFLRGWRRVQAAGRTGDGAISVQLRQVVNQSLRTADRCTTCHVAMGPGEGEVTGAPLFKKHPRVTHDPAVYGCTICHGGQGAATDKEDAHGDVHFWPEPMIPVKLSEAGCGTCHAAPGIPARAELRAAQAVFERLDCHACHRLDGRGGTIRPDGGGMEGPDLTSIAVKGWDEAWHDKHAAQAERAASGPWKISFAPVQAEDRAMLTRFLRTRHGASRLIEAKAVFFSHGCL
ncbi:MAG: c-type cytochrome, partial [Acidobacteria bacterium]|nr:c-type cytochrome [Acidobacteriota bacterium]